VSQDGKNVQLLTKDLMADGLAFSPDEKYLLRSTIG